MHAGPQDDAAHRNNILSRHMDMDSHGHGHGLAWYHEVVVPRVFGQVNKQLLAILSPLGITTGDTPWQ